MDASAAAAATAALRQPPLVAVGHAALPSACCSPALCLLCLTVVPASCPDSVHGLASPVLARPVAASEVSCAWASACLVPWCAAYASWGSTPLPLLAAGGWLQSLEEQQHRRGAHASMLLSAGAAEESSGERKDGAGVAHQKR
ncbi:hypothetical protein ABPG75_012856 [Micractinium tetrahymenae]